MARVDAAAPHGRHRRPRDGRPGGGRQGERPGAARAARRARPWSTTRAQARARCRGSRPALPRWPARRETAFVTSTDLPFLHPAFIRRVLRVLDAPGGPDVALPVARGYQQPLAAAYRTSLAELAERLVKEDRLRPAFLFAEAAVSRLDDATLLADPVLAALDPDLDSVLNVNTPDAYQAARLRPAPEVTVELSGALVGRPCRGGPLTVRAATLREAADAVGLPSALGPGRRDQRRPGHPRPRGPPGGRATPSSRPRRARAAERGARLRSAGPSPNRPAFSWRAAGVVAGDNACGSHFGAIPRWVRITPRRDGLVNRPGVVG